MKDIILVCEDLFGMEIYSIIKRINEWDIKHSFEARYNILGYISNNKAAFRGINHPIKRLGSVQEWEPISDEKYIIGMAVPERKRIAVDVLKARGCEFETVFAPWVLAPSIKIGEGSIVAAYSIKAGIHIGDYVTLIESMITSQSVGNYSTILRFSNITGDVGQCTYIGNHVYLHLGKDIGDNCYVASGSIVVKNVKSGVAVAGVPAKKNK